MILITGRRELTVTVQRIATHSSLSHYPDDTPMAPVVAAKGGAPHSCVT